jgi:lysophospholipase L1-like esterase
MQFRTQVPIPTFNHPIDYSSRIVSLGSCFAVNIAEKFDYFKFQNTVNPFGILFHPLALEKFIGFAVNKTLFTDSDIFFHNERWHCFDAHSEISNSDKRTFLEELNSKIAASKISISDASHCIITLGTAWVYRNLESDAIVANCHKVPQKQFKKELLAIADITRSIRNIIQLLQQGNPQLQIIFTVSPVRHIKDGFVQNQQSKSHLIAALHEVLNDAENAVYFPSYEIMMDELRDYRFYSEDMLHPSKTAIDFIWERFTSAFLTDNARNLTTEVDSIQRALSHRPFDAESTAYKRFLETVSTRINTLQKQFPHIVF